MGSRPLRMKVRWGCPPPMLSTPPHRTQSWRPCLPGQPWASGWRSTDRPVPSPRGWTIGFSEWGAPVPLFPEVHEELTKSWSPLISPRLWESRLTQLKVWWPPRPSGRCTCAGHLWRWWVVYAPNIPGSTTWLCEPPLACLFPCYSCAFHTLSRDLQVWRHEHLVPHSVSTQLDVPGGERPRLRM